MQKAWRDANVPQCGFCQAGQIMQAAAFLASTKNPTDQEITEAMSGNICRCGCYQRIHAARQGGRHGSVMRMTTHDRSSRTSAAAAS